MYRVLFILVFLLFPATSSAYTLFEHEPLNFNDQGGGSAFTISGMSANGIYIASTTPSVSDIQYVDGIQVYISGSAGSSPFDIMVRLCETSDTYCHGGSGFNYSSFSATTTYTVPGYYTFSIPLWTRTSATSSINVQAVRTSGSGGVIFSGVFASPGFLTGDSFATPAVNTFVALSLDGFTPAPVPTASPWVQITSPNSVATYSTNVPVTFSVNTGTTTIDRVVVQIDSTYQSFLPREFPITASGISTFSTTFPLPALNDAPLVTVTAWHGTTTAYASSSVRFTVLPFGGSPMSLDPEQFVDRVMRECYTPETYTGSSSVPLADELGIIWVGFKNFWSRMICYVFSPPKSSEVASIILSMSSSTPFVFDATDALTQFSSLASGASSSTISGSFDISWDLPIPGATTTVEMFSVNTMTYLMGDAKAIFRTICQVGLWLAFMAMVIRTVESSMHVSAGRDGIQSADKF